MKYVIWMASEDIATTFKITRCICVAENGILYQDDEVEDDDDDYKALLNECSLWVQEGKLLLLYVVHQDGLIM